MVLPVKVDLDSNITQNQSAVTVIFQTDLKTSASHTLLFFDRNVLLPHHCCFRFSEIRKDIERTSGFLCCSQKDRLCRKDGNN